MKFGDVQYLTVQDVLLLHEKVLLPGEDPGVLKPSELDAAVMAVQATYMGEPLLNSLAQVAAAYVFYFNRSHVFLDGNKRTSIVSAFLFLEANGFRLEPPSSRPAAGKIDWLGTVVAVVRREISQGQLTQRFALAMGADEEIEA